MSKRNRTKAGGNRAADRTLGNAPAPAGPLPKLHQRGPRSLVLPVVALAVLFGILLLLVWSRSHWSRGPLGPQPVGPAHELATPPIPWKVSSALDQVVEDFVRAKETEPAPDKLLGPAPVFDDTPVSEEEAERRQAEYFLRSPDLKIVAIWRGEPDGKGKQRLVPRLYTLVTQGNVASPRLQVKMNNKVSPTSRTMNNPDLVVRVVENQGQQVLQAVRAELHTGP
jgi:hypothetical protein